jgi:multidrug resistance protein MdtO
MPEKIAKGIWSAETQGTPLLGALWETLKPFSGRAQLTLRLAVVCTAVVLVADIFRLPFQDLMPFFVLFITKEDKVTTVLSALLILFAVTVAIGAAIVIYKCTGNRAEFRIPAIAAEIFVGMYLFRVLSIGPVGWILGFVCAATQSLVYLLPSPEETVHQFLWFWVIIAFSVGIAWLANLLLFPVSPTRLFQRELVAEWHAVSAATAQLSTGSPSAGAQLLRPLAKRGPIRFLKLLKLSLMESPYLGGQKVPLTRVILGLDKITKLLFSYACLRLRSSAPAPISSTETLILSGLQKDVQRFEREFEGGLVPSGTTPRPPTKTAGDIASQLLEAENTLEDLAAEGTEPENRSEKTPAARPKPSLFVADAFSNPRHVQFALKVTLAGMLGYLFYTASDYYGIHTVFYTPLIIALASTGATVHKGLLRIVGCIIGGALGLICSIWVIPRFETLGTFLLIVFCVHGLAAWIAFGSERISYVGLQIALAFDLGFLQGYGPPTNIDPLRDRFIGIVLGIGIITIVFSLVWPESADSSARERLGACLRTIARLLHLSGSNKGSQISASQREQVELQITSRLSEANSFEEQAAFEALLYGSEGTGVSRLAKASAGAEEIYLACLPWLREQASLMLTPQDGEPPKTGRELIKLLGDVIEESADLLEEPGNQTVGRAAALTDRLLEQNKNAGDTESSGSGSLQELIGAVVQMQMLLRSHENVETRW